MADGPDFSKTGGPWRRFRSWPIGAQMLITMLVVFGVGVLVLDEDEVSTTRSARTSPADPTTSTTVDIAALYEATARVQCSEAYEDPSVRRIIDRTGEVGIRFAGDNFMSGFQSSESAPKDPAILRRVRAACEESLREAAGLP